MTDVCEYFIVYEAPLTYVIKFNPQCGSLMIDSYLTIKTERGEGFYQGHTAS